MARDTTLQRRLDAPGGDGPTQEGANASRCLIGTCSDDRHPRLQGRVRIRWSELGSGDREAWLPVLQSLSIRVGDRVLVQHMENWPEPVVAGVLDGFATRPEVEAREAAHLELKADEAVELRGPDGTPLLELRPGPAGPLLRILGDDLDVDMPGRLRLRAGNLQFVARKGSVRIEASDDVVVEGEVIKLN